MKTLSLTKETIQVLQADDLHGVIGGLGPVSSARPNAPVSSARPDVHAPVSSAKPNTPVSSARPDVHHHAPVSSAKPHAPVSSARPGGGGSLSSVLNWWAY